MNNKQQINRQNLKAELNDRIDTEVFWKDKEFFENICAYITELENNLDECEMGYSATLFLERCKMKDLQGENAKLKDLCLLFSGGRCRVCDDEMFDMDIRRCGISNEVNANSKGKGGDKE